MKKSFSLEKSTYVWLPFCLNHFDNTRLISFDKWDFSVFNSFTDRLIAPAVAEKENQITWESVDNAHAYKIFKNGKFFSVANSSKFDIPIGFSGVTDIYTVQSWNITGKNSPASNTITKTWNEPGEIYLSDKIPEYSKQGWGSLQKDKSIQLPQITINGKVFQKGLGTHAISEIVYRIDGNYSKFTAWFGVDYFPKFSDKSSVQFEVWSDGEILYRSGIKKVTDNEQFIEIDITGTNELKLIM